VSASTEAPISPRRADLPSAAYHPRFFHVVRFVFQRLIRLILDVRVSGVEHLPRTGPALVAGNHRGFLDGPMVAIFAPREAQFLAKSELFSGPLARLLLWVGQIPIDRGRADREALRRASAVLTDGRVLGIFPEGTRGSGTVDSVQHGIAYVALRAPGVPVVPVACLGTEQAMPKGARLPRWRTRVDIVFGPAFQPTAQANPRARSAMAATAEEIRVHLAAHVRDVEAARRAAGVTT
jgi:1-acyl-sn-glycerol-3-phosphate acyltransferase